MNCKLPPTGHASATRQKKQPPIFLLLLAGLGVASLVISCSTFNTTDEGMFIPPKVPGATYVGSDKCAECHEDITRFFKTATHARLMAPGTNAVRAGCESCHGAGSEHIKVGGGPGTIVNPRKTPESCFQCHLDKRGQFNLPYHHPVLEGKITCINCHEPHKGDAILGGVTSLQTQRDLCGECHLPQRNPFVFEHEAVREGCTSCHAVHGSVNAKMLQQRNGNLCLKCHMQRQRDGQIYIGTVSHSNFLPRGACWSGGCHEAIHGSQVSELLRF